MSNLELLRLAMLNNVEEETPRAMYIDELMNATTKTREEAEDEAACHWWPARARSRMIRALIYLEGHGPVARRLQWLAWSEAGSKSMDENKIIVAAGYQLPTRRMPQQWWRQQIDTAFELGAIRLKDMKRVRSLPRTGYVVVGADWVLAEAVKLGATEEPLSRYEPQEKDE